MSCEAQISSAAADIQYPPEAATFPIEAIIFIPFVLAYSNSSRITSEAKALPPPESTLSTIAFVSSSS